MHIRRYTANINDLANPSKINGHNSLPHKINNHKKMLVSYRVMLDSLTSRIYSFAEFLESLNNAEDLESEGIDILDILDHYEEIFCDIIDFENNCELNNDNDDPRS